MATSGHDHDSGETDAAREEGLRIVRDGYDPQQVHELLAGYKEQMDRLEQVLGSVQAALGATGEERVPGEEIDPPSNQALQLAADYRPSTLRFDPSPVSARVAPGAPLPARPGQRSSVLLPRLALEAGFLILVVLVLAYFREPPLVIIAGAAGAWVAVILVEVLLARLQRRVVHAQLQEHPVGTVPPVPQPARPEVVALRFPHPQEPAPQPAESEPVDAVTGPDDVWVVPQEVLVAEPALDEQTDTPLEVDEAAVVLEDTLEEVAIDEDEQAPPADEAVEEVAQVEEALETPSETEDEAEPEASAEPAAEESEPQEGLLPHAEHTPVEPAWHDTPLTNDGWETILDLEAEEEPPTPTRRWPFARRGAEEPTPQRPLTPPDPELSRVPLPPVLIDPLAEGSGPKRRSRRRRRV